MKEAGEDKYIAAIQIISSISDDARGELPPCVDQVATLLRSIESSKCLAEGSMPVLTHHVLPHHVLPHDVLPHDVPPHDVHAKWQSAFDAMISKLELLKARESKLKEWKFTTVEEMHRRLSNLLMLRFPLTITEKITKMK